MLILEAIRENSKNIARYISDFDRLAMAAAVSSTLNIFWGI